MKCATLDGFISIERLREVLEYDALTGEFKWLVNKGMRVCIGKPVGGLDINGYLRIKVDGKKLAAHRLAWAYVFNEWPEHEIDHKDGVRTNNRIGNLRQATDAQNCANRRTYRTNRSGHRGVRWRADAGKWEARLGVNGKKICLGHHVRIEDAIAARAKAELEHFGEFAPRDSLG
jgi:hypothetical protein